MNSINSGDMHDLTDYEVTNNGTYPEWMKDFLSDKVGKLCVLTDRCINGIFLGLSEDDMDYYFKVLSLHDDKIEIIYLSCCSSLTFVNELSDKDSELRLREKFKSMSMRVEVIKITNINNAKEFITASLNDHKESKIKNLKKLYLSEHSPMYTQVFIVKLYNIPSYVSTHFRTHKKNFIAETVTTNRNDRGGSVKAGRMTPVDMIIYCNAKTLVDMSLKRLCNHADSIARKVMGMIKEEVRKVDEDLYRFMVPQCIYRCGLCQEWKSCGYVKTKKFKDDLKSYLSGFENNCMDNLLNL